MWDVGRCSFSSFYVKTRNPQLGNPEHSPCWPGTAPRIQSGLCGRQWLESNTGQAGQGAELTGVWNEHFNISVRKCVRYKTTSENCLWNYFWYFHNWKNPDVNFNLIYICLLQNICNYGFGASSFMIVAMGWVLQKLLYSERNGEKWSNNPVQIIVCNCSTTLKITRWLDGRWHPSSRLDVFMAWHHDF